MKQPYPFLILLVLLVLSHCSNAKRIEHLESRVWKLETAVFYSTNEKRANPNTFTVFLSSGGFAHPGEYKVPSGMTIAQLMAAKGEGWTYCKEIQCLRQGTNYSSQTTTNFWNAPVEQGDVFFGIGSNVYYAPSK